MHNFYTSDEMEQKFTINSKYDLFHCNQQQIKVG